MINFLEETQAVLMNNKYTSEDIKFIGSILKSESCTWSEFVILANFEYDDGYGGVEVRDDLVIVMNNGCIFKRGEYDGSEWWEIHKPFNEVEVYTKITKLKG